MAPVTLVVGQDSKPSREQIAGSGGGQPVLPAAAAHLAATLPERAALQRAAGGGAPLAAEAMALGARRLARWRDEAGLPDDDRFAQRLARDGLTPAQLTHLLGDSSGAASADQPLPAWATALGEAYTRPADGPTLPLPASAELDPAAEGLLAVAAPLLERARRRLREGLHALTGQCGAVPFEPDVVEPMLFAGVLRRVFGMINRTLVLELHVARLEGRLVGDTPVERFASFVAQLQQPETAMALWTEYPVLARALVERLDLCVASGLEFLTHLCADWPLLRETFSLGDDPGRIVALDGRAGDSHRGARAVAILTFRSGLKLVYKPKSLAADIHFQELLEWLNARGATPAFRTVQVLDRGTHGWVEFVAADPCTSEEQVERFYARQGAYLALLHVLQATDFHSENLIANGEHPVLVDLEALFHPNYPTDREEQADALAQRTLANSVMRIGLLPDRTWATDESDGVDISGLGNANGQLSPEPVPYLADAGTDAMRVERQRMELANEGHHRPTLSGAWCVASNYVDFIVDGFARMHRLLQKERAALLAEDGPLTRFADDEVRVIMRATRTYDLLLRESFHPDVLRNALDRDRLFDRLWVATRVRPELPTAIGAERADLCRGDVPMFAARPSSRDLWTSDGERLPEMFPRSGLDLARRCLAGLGEDDLTRQLWYIHASFATLSMDGVTGGGAVYRLTPCDEAAEPARLLAAARDIGDRLARLALRGADDATWIGVALSRRDQWTLQPLGADLYDGVPGVALYLAYLGAVTGEQRCTALAEAALHTTLGQVERQADYLKDVGGFGGWGGVIYLLTHLGVLWGRWDLLARAEAMLPRLPALIERDEALDVIGGVAGCAAVLLGLHRATGSAAALDAARCCGERLLATARPMAQGRGWVVKGLSEQPLAGYSHGAAGIAWALLQLADATGDTRFRIVAEAGLAYERSLYLPDHGNWPDLREDPRRPGSADEPAVMAMWCHGAPGIALSRLAMLDLLDDPRPREEVEVALATTWQSGFGAGHSLCHGDLGNLEVLHEAARALNDDAALARVRRVASALLDSIERDGPRCGVPLGVETPGLMTGLAGIGYGLLRLAAPERVPCVLRLAPPPVAAWRAPDPMTAAAGASHG